MYLIICLFKVEENERILQEMSWSWWTSLFMLTVHESSLLELDKEFHELHWTLHFVVQHVQSNQSNSIYTSKYALRMRIFFFFVKKDLVPSILLHQVVIHLLFKVEENESLHKFLDCDGRHVDLWRAAPYFALCCKTHLIQLDLIYFIPLNLVLFSFFIFPFIFWKIEL